MAIPDLRFHCPGSFLLTKYQSLSSIQKFSNIRFPYTKISAPIVQKSFRFSCIKTRATNGQNGVQNEYYDDESSYEPFWLSLFKDIAWSLRALFVFLAEQPSQLKYIEWPGFQSTLKTAALTLVIVAFLIVALCSIDSALCYLLALFLRKSV
ncbi:hypothetical protein LUZ60_002782 [Juncus effusus]|nr:hypothetical protein LUZ60_002782 [Juncus effusus]